MQKVNEALAQREVGKHSHGKTVPLLKSFSPHCAASKIWCHDQTLFGEKLCAIQHAGRDKKNVQQRLMDPSLPCVVAQAPHWFLPIHSISQSD